MQEVENGCKFPHCPEVPSRHLRRFRWSNQRRNDLTGASSVALPAIPRRLISIPFLFIVFILVFHHLRSPQLLPPLLLLRRLQPSLRHLLLMKALLCPKCARTRGTRSPGYRRILRRHSRIRDRSSVVQRVMVPGDVRVRGRSVRNDRGG